MISSRPGAAVLTALTATAAAILCLAGPAAAKTFVVTKRSDPVPDACKPRNCSLREAVLAANARPGPDVIELANAKKPYGLALASSDEDGAFDGDLDVTNDALTIRHRGKGRATIDANGVDRVFEVFAGAPTTFKKLVIRGGALGAGDGGGIRSDADIRVIASVVRGNVAADDGGGIDVDQEASLLIRRSLIAGNRASGPDGDGGGVNGSTDPAVTTIVASRVVGNRASRDGGGVEAASAGLQILASTIARNRAEDGSGGGVNNDSSAPSRVVGSTFSLNLADDDGGGYFADGPAVEVVNSTFSGNRADGNGGAMHAQDGAAVALNAVTVAGNVADANANASGSGGGLFRLSSTGFEVENTLLALNRLGTGERNDCAGDSKIDTLGHNLVSTLGPAGACDGFGPPDGAGDILGANPRLARLKRNGGPTQTHALLKRSPAINKASRASAPKRDQRGRKRGRKKDIGAFERNVGR